MRKTAITLGLFAAFLANAQSIKTTIDLVNVKDDKVAVTMEFPKMKSGDIKFHFPKTVPGTYSVDDYGRFVEGIKFFDNKGRELTYTKVNDNTYSLKNAKDLTRITYLVNDSFDDEMDNSKHKAVFSPSGTDIEEGKVYMVNTHGFVGYIDNMQDVPYQLIIQKPAGFYGTTALVDQDKSDATDTFTLANYAKVTDSPLMYTKPDYITFNAGGMDLVLGVYSPTGKYKAADFKDNLEKMVLAQKKFLGDMNTNKKYAIMLYLSGGDGPQIKGFGALEHHESTSVVLPEMMPKEAIDKTITDVVSHEFFHTVNPLKTHSEEIHYFDYADPKMSQHLWMYEGGTEYFANLFQIQEGLINKDEFLQRINEKITNSKNYDDTMPFTVMSKNILKDEYKDQYRNVYEKGTLLAMCLDIELRKLSNGEMGYRDMIRKLSQRFGENKPFKDDKLIDELVTVTGYPQVKDFYNKYIAGNQPTPYAEYLNMVGVEAKKKDTPPLFWFIKDPNQTGYNDKNNTFVFDESSALSPFAKSIGFKITDEIVALDGKTINVQNMQEFISYAKSIKEGQNVTVTILRKNGDKTDKIDLKGKAVLDKMTIESLQYKTNPTPAEQKLQDQWLTGKK
ncbi:MAG: PDZ domain-containing protein [Chryseobacterium sp.]|uniref:M61 family metallopeptidase n=1 Tax=Chryseobacterium carnipullorum TaxID=1124835 RepID=UPI00091843B8|nr:PDZ domain-containing protein [Chryseobacterium carnipullorum]MDN5397023.1 PDZ domain-containing protein [Chryseobacterium sp.]MDN5478922.1 PDZ domain-containing protein [Chryseobacterium sp.]SHL93831.1 Predicted metalloprotease, contains C-terminal PDZ domain [Chryseobacterium carnipullorum]